MATDVWGTAVRALALSLTHMTLTVDVERIIIGGGLSHAGENLLAPLREECASMLTFRDAPEIVRAPSGSGRALGSRDPGRPRGRINLL